MLCKGDIRYRFGLSPFRALKMLSLLRRALPIAIDFKAFSLNLTAMVSIPYYIFDVFESLFKVDLLSFAQIKNRQSKIVNYL